MADSDYTLGDEADNDSTPWTMVTGTSSNCVYSSQTDVPPDRGDQVAPRTGLQTSPEGLFGHLPIHYHVDIDAMRVHGGVLDLLLQVHPAGRTGTRRTSAIRVRRSRCLKLLSRTG